MSILLDAVTRAKQQERQIDPVITPRAQYRAMQPKWPLALKLTLLGAGLGGAVVLAWLVSAPASQSVDEQVPSPMTQAVQVRNVPAKPPVAVTAQDSGVRLAGKVALPLAVERPSRHAAPVFRTQPAADTELALSSTPSLSQMSSAPTTPVELSGNDAEPIILGANANHRGRELLNSLKAQVDEAAADVGLDKVVQPEPKKAAKPQDATQLMAAFEAALKEVEKERAVTTPVTEPKLDPIPEPMPDELPRYGQLPAGVQLQVPEFNILAHVYASDPNNRWLNVDGAELQQGDMIGGKLTIIEIRPRDVVLEVAGTEFKVPAI